MNNAATSPETPHTVDELLTRIEAATDNAAAADAAEDFSALHASACELASLWGQLATAVHAEMNQPAKV